MDAVNGDRMNCQLRVLTDVVSAVEYAVQYRPTTPRVRGPII